MDETLTRVAIDVSNRPYLIWNVKLKLRSLVRWIQNYSKNGSKLFTAAGITLHVENIYGDNSHHIIEVTTKV